jgi:hypothetical protein
VSFIKSQATLRWDVSAGDNNCRLNWAIEPWYEDSKSGHVNVEARHRETGNKTFQTPFAEAEVRIDSNCPRWLLTIQGYEPPPSPTPRPVTGSNCHPSYQGACLKQNAGDYDCAGGSGNGPNYVAGPIYVVGYDEFDLDRDSDGIGCE